MCTGAEILLGTAVAGTIGGAATSYAGAQTSKRAMENTVANQLAYTQSLQKQATPLYQQSLQASSPEAAKADIQQGQQKALQDYERASHLSDTTSTSPTNAQEKVAQTRSKAAIRQAAQANANVQGYGNLQQQWNLNNANVGNKLSNINQQGAISAQNFPYLLQLAQQKGKNLQSIGSLIGSLSSLAGVGAIGMGALNSAPTYGADWSAADSATVSEAPTYDTTSSASSVSGLA